MKKTKQSTDHSPNIFRYTWTWISHKVNALLSLPAVKRIMLHTIQWGTRLPVVVRVVLGLVFIVGGLLGFLPILGFWMIPVGVGFLAWGIPRSRRRMRAWMRRVNHDLKKHDEGNLQPKQSTPRTS